MGPGREGSETTRVSSAGTGVVDWHLPSTLRAYSALARYLDGLDRYTTADARVSLGAAPHPGGEPVQVIDLRVEHARSAYRSLARQDPGVGDYIDLGL